MPLILRHCRPDAPEGLCYGRSDLPLAPGWEAETAGLAATLPPVAGIVTSPLSRCRRIAERIAAARGLPLTEDARLREMDFGAWEGRPWDALPRAEIDAWAADFLNARPHGGESVAMLADRVAAALAETTEGTLWVSHSGVARAAAALTGHPDGWRLTLPFGGVLRLG